MQHQMATCLAQGWLCWSAKLKQEALTQSRGQLCIFSSTSVFGPRWLLSIKYDVCLSNSSAWARGTLLAVVCDPPAVQLCVLGVAPPPTHTLPPPPSPERQSLLCAAFAVLLGCCVGPLVLLLGGVDGDDPGGARPACVGYALAVQPLGAAGAGGAGGQQQERQ
jgi:hypothetical protein